MNVQSLVTVSLVKSWLYGEEENVRPYLAAWKGENPYNIISRMRFNFWAMVIVIIATAFWAKYGYEDVKILGYICSISFFSLGYKGWRPAHKSLVEFCFAVAWCEKHHITNNLLHRSPWTKDNVGEVLRFFVPFINDYIIPHEREIHASQHFPKRLTEARKKHRAERAILIEMIKNISPMFNHFKGVENPLAEAFRLARAAQAVSP